MRFIAMFITAVCVLFLMRLFKLCKVAIFDALGVHVNCRIMEDTRVLIGKLIVS